MWNPPIVRTIATENKGIDDLSAAIKGYSGYRSEAEGASNDRKTAIARWRLTELLQEALLERLLASNGSRAEIDRLAEQIADKKIDPYSAVDRLLDKK